VTLTHTACLCKRNNRLSAYWDNNYQACTRPTP